MERGADTKGRILDASEQLFAAQGFAGTSLRTIVAEAGVNLAAIHYHFGSKENLIQAVFARRLGPLNQQRLGMLDACEQRAQGAPPSLEEVLEAFVGPFLRLRKEDKEHGASFCRLIGRTYTEPVDPVVTIVGKQFEAVITRFGETLQRILPHLSKKDLFWRFHFAIGSMAYTLSDTYRLVQITNGLCNPADVEGTISRLVVFLAAAFRAPAE